jgi:hypothetical protein
MKLKERDLVFGVCCQAAYVICALSSSQELESRTRAGRRAQCPRGEAE